VEFSVDLEAQVLTTPGGLSIRFEIDAFRKESLIQGLDDIAWTQKHHDEILELETRQRQEQSWLWDENTRTMQSRKLGTAKNRENGTPGRDIIWAFMLDALCSIDPGL
jgi:hypothetical protein